MAVEQAGEGQPEVKSYDAQMQDDVKAAFDEVTSKTAEPAPEAKPETADKPVTADKPAEARTDGERPRDEQGRFKAAEAKDEPAGIKADTPAVGAKPVKTPSESFVEQPLPGTAKAIAAAPPTSWSIKAKAEWDKLPTHVRDDIAKREAEVSAGFQGYQGLKPFIDAVKQRGQDPGQVINSFMGIEQTLRNDPRAGFLHIASNLGLTQHQAAQFFAGIANDLGYAPSNGQAAANQNGFAGSPDQTGADPMALRQALDPVVSPLMQRLQQLEQHLTQQTEVQKNQRLQSASAVIETFRQDPKNRYYDNVEQTIGSLLEGGVIKRTGDLAADLACAYDAACQLNPEIREVLANERIAKTAEDKARAAKEAAEKARQAGRSVSGSPSPGASSQPNKRDPKLSYDEDLQNDVRAAYHDVIARA